MDLGEKIIKGLKLDADEALRLLGVCSDAELFEAADKVRRHFHSNKIETCSIINARSGRCPEDCKWCAQSAHNKTAVEVYPLIDASKMLEAARQMESAGVGRFSLVTSGRAQKGEDFQKILDGVKLMRAETKIGLCASLGLLNKGQMMALKEAGVSRYHCNLESAPSFFSALCSTHTIEDKMRSIKFAQEAGMEVCSGGIIGMGESPAQRVEFALALRDLGVDSIPVNILQPIKGTPLENMEPLSAREILRTFAIFKLINPRAQIRFAGGRAAIGELQELALKCGVSAAIVGDMLTTIGSKMCEDFELFKRLGYEY